ncbi:MAG TPA: LamB/YcsF family protein [Bacilli bacterium]|nr:LamB/YcsF family protein [Bacilli bacterium]
MRIDLNSDLGESFGLYKIGQDEQVLSVISSANIACGYHAGDHSVMYETVQLAKEKGVAIGAHPGTLDLQGFGRRMMELEAKDVYRFMLYQLGALRAFTHVHGVKMQHVKPHGALYNMAANNKTIATAIAEAVYDFSPELILFGLSGSELTKAGESIGLKIAHEVFADRTYQANGTLTSRSEKNALITDHSEAVERVLQMVKHGVTEAVDGTEIELQADTICVHGDSSQAFQFVEELRRGLEEQGIQIKAVGETNE